VGSSDPREILREQRIEPHAYPDPAPCPPLDVGAAIDRDQLDVDPETDGGVLIGQMDNDGGQRRPMTAWTPRSGSSLSPVQIGPW
jgi:hypothetical protein